MQEPEWKISQNRFLCINIRPYEFGADTSRNKTCLITYGGPFFRFFEKRLHPLCKNQSGQYLKINFYA